MFARLVNIVSTSLEAKKKPVQIHQALIQEINIDGLSALLKGIKLTEQNIQDVNRLPEPWQHFLKGIFVLSAPAEEKSIEGEAKETSLLTRDQESVALKFNKTMRHDSVIAFKFIYNYYKLYQEQIISPYYKRLISNFLLVLASQGINCAIFYSRVIVNIEDHRVATTTPDDELHFALSIANILGTDDNYAFDRTNELGEYYYLDKMYRNGRNKYPSKQTDEGRYWHKVYRYFEGRNINFSSFKMYKTFIQGDFLDQTSTPPHGQALHRLTCQTELSIAYTIIKGKKIITEEDAIKFLNHIDTAWKAALQIEHASGLNLMKFTIDLLADCLRLHTRFVEPFANFQQIYLERTMGYFKIIQNRAKAATRSTQFYTKLNEMMRSLPQKNLFNDSELFESYFNSCDNIPVDMLEPAIFSLTAAIKQSAESKDSHFDNTLRKFILKFFTVPVAACLFTIKFDESAPNTFRELSNLIEFFWLDKSNEAKNLEALQLSAPLNPAARLALAYYHANNEKYQLAIEQLQRLPERNDCFASMAKQSLPLLKEVNESRYKIRLEICKLLCSAAVGDQTKERMMKEHPLAEIIELSEQRALHLFERDMKYVTTTIELYRAKQPAPKTDEVKAAEPSASPLLDASKMSQSGEKSPKHSPRVFKPVAIKTEKHESFSSASAPGLGLASAQQR